MRIFLTVLLCLSMATLDAQTKSMQKTPPLAEGKASEVGISAERLVWVDNMIRESIKDNQIPGAVALIARNGKIVYHKAFGMADTETGKAQQKDDIFRIASQTKAITP